MSMIFSVCSRPEFNSPKSVGYAMSAGVQVASNISFPFSFVVVSAPVANSSELNSAFFLVLLLLFFD